MYERTVKFVHSYTKQTLTNFGNSCRSKFFNLAKKISQFVASSALFGSERTRTAKILDNDTFMI